MLLQLLLRRQGGQRNQQDEVCIKISQKKHKLYGISKKSIKPSHGDSKKEKHKKKAE